MLSLSRYITIASEQFHPAAGMIRVAFRSPGYHTALENGTMVHTTRETVYYALALLDSIRSGVDGRVEPALQAVLALQDSDPVSASFGSWPWTLEEPIDKMVSVDMNWADFIGVALSLILIKHGERLSRQVRKEITDALKNALLSDFRRNMRPSYTNIAVMGASLHLLGGRAIDEEFFVGYGRRRLERFSTYTDAQGGFNEYNSPTYTVVAATELERILRFSEDTAAQNLATALLERTWHGIVAHLHPGTGEWAGPHSRAYSAGLMPSTRDWLAARLPESVATAFRNPGDADDLADGSILNRVPEFHEPVPCPESALSADTQITAQDCDGQSNQFTYIQFSDRPAVEATLYRATDVAFGTVSEECFWTQRHGAIAYLAGSTGEGTMRVRALKDGRDFASLGFRSVQAGGAALFGLVAYNNLGDWHLMLDRPTNETFSGHSLSLVLDAPESWVAMDDGHFAFTVGQTTIQMTPGFSQSAGKGLSWRVADSRLELPLHESGSRTIALANLVPLVVVFGIAVLTSGAPRPDDIDSPPTIDDWITGATPTPRELEATWKPVGNRSIVVPTAPVAYPFPG